MARVSARSVYVVSALLWLCLGQGHPAQYPRYEAEQYSYDASPQTLPFLPPPMTSPSSLSSASSNGRLRDHSTNTLDGFQSPPGSSVGHESQQCEAGTWHRGAYPKGFYNGPSGVRSVVLLMDGQERSESQCFQKCCELGWQRCQYLWFFRTKCYAISCDLYSDHCDPMSVPSNIPTSTSVYIDIRYSNTSPPNEETPPPSEETPPPSVETLPRQPLVIDQDYGSPRAIISPSVVETQVSVVSLSAQHSSSKPQGTVQYRWEVISAKPAGNMKEVVMNGARTDTLLISALSPGSYTVQLTVSDVAGHSDTATATLTILNAHSEAPVPPSSTSTTAAASSTTTSSTTTSSTTTTTTTTTIAVPRSTVTSQTKDDHFPTKLTALDQTRPTPTTTSTTPLPPRATALSQETTVQDQTGSGMSWGLLMKVGIPVLCIVLLILTVSGCLVGLSSCIFMQSDKRKYRYRKLMYTDT